MAVGPGLPDAFLRLVPSYAVYPPASRFGAGFRAGGVPRRLARMRAAQAAPPLRLSLRLPPKDGAAPLASLAKEIGLYGELLRGGHRLLEVHWHGQLGGYRALEVMDLADALRRAFPQAEHCPWRATLDPGGDVSHAGWVLSVLAPERIDIVPASRRDPLTLAQNTESLMAAARLQGSVAVGGALIYGMPWQSQAQFRRAVAALAAWQPEHLRLFDHAELEGAPAPGEPGLDRREARELLDQARGILGGEGYVPIGDRLLAAPRSTLARARTLGRLSLQPDGLTTRAAAVTLGLGPAAVGAIGAAYYRNLVGPAYTEALRRRKLPVMDGLALGGEDLARRSAIQGLLIDFFVDTGAVEIACGLRFRERFRPELRALERAAEAGLVEWSESVLQLTPSGQAVAGAVAMIFDSGAGIEADGNC